MDSPSNVASLPPHQKALRERCFHPTGAFVEFEAEQIEQSIPDRFENLARQQPWRLAVKTGRNEFTYNDLNKAANRIAHAVLAKGEGRERVAVLCHQGAVAIAGILGVLKAGKTYVPLDPTAPNARNEYIIEDAQIGLVVTDGANCRLAPELVHGKIPVINIDSLGSGFSSENPGLKISPDCLSYIMYTSGSTGEPKGVMQNHRNVLYKTMGWINLVHISPEDRLSLLRSLNVSGSIRDLFGGLLSGAAVLTFDIKREGLAHLAKWLVDERITIFNSVVTLFRNFGAMLTGEDDFLSVRLVKLSGEPVYKRDMELCKKHFSRNFLAVNLLASAEVGSTRAYFMDKETPLDDNLVPIGYPLDGCEVLLLDSSGKGLGFNQVGEIAVRSRYLSPGYWRRPDLTATSFFADPEGSDARVYRTGDLGYMLPDGCLVHRGRKGSHVKIRGYSVEINEIEAVLLEFESVKDAVVTTKENAQGNQILVAYVVPRVGSVLTVSSVRTAIAVKLPDYMIPSAFVFLDCLPLAGPGKVNLQALPDPGRTRPDLETPFARSRTPVEEAIVKIWIEILGVDQIGIHDRFLDLGGDSLLAGRVISKIIEKFHVDVVLESLFEKGTVADLAGLVVTMMARRAGSEGVERLVADVDRLSDEQIKTLLASQKK